MTQGIVIPEGKKIRIKNGSNNMVDVPMILDEPVTLNLNSNFGPLIPQGGAITKTLSLAGGLLNQLSGGQVSFGGQIKTFGLHVWEGTDPVTFNVTITFQADKTNVDARTQVYLPAQTLMAIPLPDTGNFDIGKGGFSRALDSIAGQTLVAPGPTAAALIGKGGDFQTYSIEIGNIVRIPQAIIKKAEPTFSTETDEAGYPMWCKINLDIQSVYTATKGEVILESKTPAEIQADWYSNGGV